MASPIYFLYFLLLLLSPTVTNAWSFCLWYCPTSSTSSAAVTQTAPGGVTVTANPTVTATQSSSSVSIEYTTSIGSSSLDQSIVCWWGSSTTIESSLMASATENILGTQCTPASGPIVVQPGTGRAKPEVDSADSNQAIYAYYCNDSPSAVTGCLPAATPTSPVNGSEAFAKVWSTCKDGQAGEYVQAGQFTYGYTFSDATAGPNSNCTFISPT